MRFNDNMNQHNNQNHFEPTLLGYTEKQLLKLCRGNYNVKTLVKNYENLLAFNYALKELTKVANEPVLSAKSGMKPTYDRQPTSILKRVFDPKLPTLHEHKRVLAGKAKVGKKISTVAAFSTTEVLKKAA